MRRRLVRVRTRWIRWTACHGHVTIHCLKAKGAGGPCGTKQRPVQVMSQSSGRDALELVYCLQSSLSFCSVPSHLTQLHPQHQRILTQRQQQGGTLQRYGVYRGNLGVPQGGSKCSQ